MKSGITIGYNVTVQDENDSDIWVNDVIERRCYADVSNFASKRQQGEKANDDISLTNELSIIADPFAICNFSKITYVEMFGTKWKVSSVTIQYPRLVLNVGGVYNGE